MNLSEPALWLLASIVIGVTSYCMGYQMHKISLTLRLEKPNAIDLMAGAFALIVIACAITMPVSLVMCLIGGLTVR